MKEHAKLPDLLSLVETYNLELPPQPATHHVASPSINELPAFIDHTLLKPEATAAQIEALCQEALQHRFASVCVQPVYVPLVTRLLSTSDVKVCTVIGFPLGSNLTHTKVEEARQCMQMGAVELDMVIWVGGLKGQAYSQVVEDVLEVTQAAHTGGALLKVILETTSLTRKEKIAACLLCKEAGADFVKTSTGFASGGATVEDVDLMVRVVGPEVQVKASGGIRTLKDALAMIQAGASRLGTSAGIKIMEEMQLLRASQS
jgi:deoxyribose-phosphate aldolase